MITRMEVVSDQPDAPELLLGSFSPNSDPIKIRNIEGLGPVKADVASTAWATGRGEFFQEVSTGKRNIVITFGLSPDWSDQTISSLRQLLYTYFMPENWATYRFISDDLPTVKIYGIVESFDPNIFSEDPEIQVSILCMRPDFVDIDETTHDGVANGVPYDVDYIGSVPAGFKIVFTSTGTYTGGLNIVNTTRGKSKNLVLEGITLSSASQIEIDTLRTERHVHKVIIATGATSDILERVTSDLIWPEFLPGANELTVDADASGVHWSLSYFNRFGGL